jgi:SpoVK/Ycf46/Vps4 family AAA+-type ATPase
MVRPMEHIVDFFHESERGFYISHKKARELFCKIKSSFKGYKIKDPKVYQLDKPGEVMVFMQYNNNCKIADIYQVGVNVNTKLRKTFKKSFSDGKADDAPIAASDSSRKERRNKKRTITYNIPENTCAMYFTYNNKSYVFLSIVPDDRNFTNLYYLISNSTEDVEELEEASSEFAGEYLIGAIDIYTGNGGEEIFETSTKMEDVFMDKDKKDQLIKHAEAPFKNKDLYKKLGVPPKRGVIFVGDPGNGKTLWTEAYINEYCYDRYTKVILRNYCAEGRFRFYSEIKSITEAREKGIDCVLVLEEIDRLINDTDRALVLNTIDGPLTRQMFSGGLLILATTNHPDKVDPALINRPSRFDTVIRFDPPSENERTVYFASKLAKHSLNIPQKDVSEICKETSGLSYAHLNEIIFQSALKSLEKDCSGENLASKMMEVVKQLKGEQKDIKKLFNQSGLGDQRQAGFQERELNG